MPIVTDQGISTTKLCENSKKYLSRVLADRILVGASIKNPNFVSWEELLGIAKRNLGVHLITRLAWQLRKNAEYDGLHNKESFKQHIVNKLITLECQHLEQILEYKKQQAELRHKKRALISLVLAIVLPTLFFFTHPVLGGTAILVGVLIALIETGLFVYTVSAFVGEKIIDPEWIAECSHKKNQFLQKMDKEKTQAKYTKIIKTINKIPSFEKYKRACPQIFLNKARLSTIIEETDNENKIKSQQIPAVNTVAENEMKISNSKIRLTANATTQTPPDDKNINKPSVVYKVSFFIPSKAAFDEQQVIHQLCIKS